MDSEPLYVDNRSNDTISVYYAWGIASTPTAYPDTLLPKDSCINPSDSTEKYLSQMYKPTVLPYTKVLYDWSYHTISYDFSQLPRDTLTVIIIGNAMYKKYKWDELRLKNKILVRYDFSKEQFERCGYIVFYPPMPWMKDVKMYPIFSNFYPNEVK